MQTAQFILRRKGMSVYDKIIELGKSGATLRVIGLELGMSQKQLQERMESDPLFKEAVDASQDFCLGFYEKQMAENIDNKSYSSQTVGQLLRSNFPKRYESATYRQHSERQIDSEQSAIDFQAVTNQLIADLQKAGKT
jgi:hypothetical protein